MSINPVFVQRPKEGALIGLMVVSFGELELMCGLCAGLALSGSEIALRAIYRSRSTRGRVDIADALMRPAFVQEELEAELTQTLTAVYHCLKIRNQYAHCHWGSSHGDGVFFTDLEQAAEKRDGFDYHYKYVDLELLQEQLAYFDYGKDCFLYLEHEFRFRKKTLSFHSFPRPPEQPRPILHRPESLHIPPWLSVDQKRQHLERALAIESTSPQSERPPSILRLTREEWAAKDAKDARYPPASGEQNLGLSGAPA